MQYFSFSQTDFYTEDCSWMNKYEITVQQAQYSCKAGWSELPCITSYLNMGCCAASQDWYSTSEQNASTCQHEEKIRGWIPWPWMLCPAVCLGSAVLPETSPGEKLLRTPLLRFTQVYYKLVVRVCPQSSFTTSAVPAGARSSQDWIGGLKSYACSQWQRAFWSMKVCIAHVLPWSTRPACTLRAPL